MKKRCNRQSGFSLTEMLIATGIMTVGLVMIATIFPVGVRLTGLSAERSVAAVAADEAFAKVRLYGLRDFANWPSAQIETAAGNPNYTDSAMATYDTCADFLFTTQVLVDPAGGTDALWGTEDDRYITPGLDGTYGTTDDVTINLGSEFSYPSTVMPMVEEPQKYHWSALCRRTGLKDVQVTVFVTHKTFAGINYYGLFQDRTVNPIVPSLVYTNTSIWPMPVPVNVVYDPTKTTASPLKELEILTGAGSGNEGWDTTQTGEVLSFFSEGSTIVNNRDGKIYRVLEMKDELPAGSLDGIPETMVLYEDWQWAGYDANPSNPPTLSQSETVWVVPPGVGSDRYPCVGVFQEVIHFDTIN